MKTKPIFIVRTPISASDEEVGKLGFNLQHELKGYHVLVLLGNTKDYIFECYNTDNLDKKTFDELKKLYHEN